MLKRYFRENGYARKLVEDIYERFLSKKLDFKPILTTVSKKPMYFSLPYFGHQSVLFNLALSNLIQEYFYHLDLKLVLVNKFRIGNFFNVKDALPMGRKSSVIYQFCCPHVCGSTYVGSTIRTLGTRIFEHRGVSARTGRPLGKPLQSSVREHCESCADVGVVRLENF